MATTVITPVGVLSFPQLFEPKAAVPGGEARYSVNLVFDKEAQKHPAYTALVQAIEDEAKTFFNGKPPKNWRNPIRDAGEKDYNGYNVGDKFISAWTKSKPGLVGPGREEILLPEEIWAGQKARVSVRPFGYNTSGNAGVGLALSNVQIAKYDMPRLDGRKKASEEFDDLTSETTDEEIPF